MKVREVVIFSGETYQVPQGIQRIDTRSTHGWQVRYGGTKMFSDHSPDGSGASAALTKATKELLARIAALPAPVALQKAPSAHKTSDLPSGISGPIVRQSRRSHARSAVFSVLLPRFGEVAKCATVYIGSEHTYTRKRYAAALEKAVALRAQAEAQYAEAATRAKRKAARAMKAALKHSAAAG